jgi:hypothetical protein
LQRKTPLRAKTGLKRKTGLRAQSSKQAARRRQWSAITKAKLERGEQCVDGPAECRGPIDGDHIIPTGRGGPWTEDNHALRCRHHHEIKHGIRVVESNPQWGTA